MDNKHLIRSKSGVITPAEVIDLIVTLAYRNLSKRDILSIVNVEYPNLNISYKTVKRYASHKSM